MRLLRVGGRVGRVLDLDELHSIVVGMGGLFDLSLAASSKQDGEATRARLDYLADDCSR